MSKKLTTEEFIKRAKEVHGDKYDYSVTVYQGTSAKIKIKCVEHGVFEQWPSDHRRGSHCPKCSIESAKIKQQLTVSDFILKANDIHNNVYDYSAVEFKNAHDFIKINCFKHGEFEQRVYSHLAGHGCKFCADTKRASYHLKDTDAFIQSALKTHSNKYTYEDTQYTRAVDPITITCAKHGNFSLTAIHHLNGAGCKLCYAEEKHDVYVNKASSIHNGKYMYHNTKFKHSLRPVLVTCPEHGDFEVTASTHLQGTGCPSCNATGKSKAEYEIKEWLVSLGLEVIHGDRSLGFEIDLFIPSHNLGIEYDGIYWHSSKEKSTDAEFRKKHIFKTDECKKHDIDLLHIWDNEWNDETKKEIWKSTIKHKLGLTANKIYARKCDVALVDRSEAAKFMEANHLQGNGISTYKVGLYYNLKLVAVATFAKARYNKTPAYEIIRYATLNDYHIAGGFTKILKYMYKNGILDQKLPLVSYANKRWSHGNVYATTGFKFVHESDPCYYYTNDYVTLSHRSSFMKHKLAEKLETFDPNKSEVDNMYANQYARIWDCGNYVYIMENNNG